MAERVVAVKGVVAMEREGVVLGPVGRAAAARGEEETAAARARRKRASRTPCPQI